MVVMVYLKAFKQALENNVILKEQEFKELVTYGLKQFNDKYKGKIYPNTPFALYEKYTYEQVCQLLEWPQNEECHSPILGI